MRHNSVRLCAHLSRGTLQDGSHQMLVPCSSMKVEKRMAMMRRRLRLKPREVILAVALTLCAVFAIAASIMGS